jgi:Caspase domain
MQRNCWVALVVAFSLLAAAPAAHAEKRMALLIGNQSYAAEIGVLVNPHNDIALLEKTLRGLKFEVTSVRDASLGAMHQAVNAYARRVKAAGPDAIAFFYYAGHGAADGVVNYLIPVDAKSAEEGDLWDVSLRLTEITGKLKKEAGNTTHFVIFDACRNELKLRKAGSRALVQARGFAPVAQESGMLISYATAEGETASDIGVAAGPYASVLAEEIVKPGVEAVEMFCRVQRRVRTAIKQEPYLGFNALGDIYLAGLAPDPSKLSGPPPGSPRPGEALEAWSIAKDIDSVPALEAFIRRFGDTYYADLAILRLADLKQAEASKSAEQVCKTQMVEATGPATILGRSRGRRLALDNWTREVRTLYGERFFRFQLCARSII